MKVASKGAISRYCKLLEHCLSIATTESVHSSVIKVGLYRHTFLSNRLISLYSNFGAISSCSKLFHDLAEKNVYTWNILLSAYSKNGDIESARHLFDEMPEKDVVTWNSMVSGYLKVGLFEKAFTVICMMQEFFVRPSGFSLSIFASYVSSVQQAKEIHGCAIRHGFSGNIVIQNALIDMYGRLRILGYAIGLFSSMRERDIISWNELIVALERSEFVVHSLEFFKLMVCHGGILPDQFTLSIVMSICGDLRVLELGEQIFVLCIKLSDLSNSIVSSSIIDMYSLCGRLDCSIRFFMELVEWDSNTVNSMASSYDRSGYPEEAQRLVMMAMRKGISLTNITLIILVNTISPQFSTHLFAQAHSLVLKSGLEIDPVISNSLLKLYSEMGDLRSAVKVFSSVKTKNLITWNSMITGFAEHGYGHEALRVFKEMTEMGGAHPNRITLRGVLRACALSGLVEEGAVILSSMEEKFGVVPETEHLASMVDMFSRAGMVEEAMVFVDMMPNKRELGCIILLEASRTEGNLERMEEASRKGVDLCARSSLPYTVLARIHGSRGQWEAMARVWKAMKDKGVKKDIESSSIAIRNDVFFFRADQILHHGGESTYSILKLLERDGKDLDSLAVCD